MNPSQEFEQENPALLQLPERVGTDAEFGRIARDAIAAIEVQTGVPLGSEDLFDFSQQEHPVGLPKIAENDQWLIEGFKKTDPETPSDETRFISIKTKKEHEGPEQKIEVFQRGQKGYVKGSVDGIMQFEIGDTFFSSDVARVDDISGELRDERVLQDDQNPVDRVLTGIRGASFKLWLNNRDDPNAPVSRFVGEKLYQAIGKIQDRQAERVAPKLLKESIASLPKLKRTEPS